MCFAGGSENKASACSAGDLGSIPGSGRSPAEGNGNPLQYSCLENPVDRVSWWAAVHGITKSQTQLSDWAHTRHQQCIRLPLAQYSRPYLPWSSNRVGLKMYRILFPSSLLSLITDAVKHFFLFIGFLSHELLLHTFYPFFSWVVFFGLARKNFLIYFLK